MDYEKILSGLVRVGTVTDVDSVKHLARVKFQGENFTSGWLYVLQHPGGGLSIVPDGGHTHSISVHDTFTGGGSGTASYEPDHNHTGSTTTSWMPTINATVLVVFLPVFNADGFIIGGIG